MDSLPWFLYTWHRIAANLGACIQIERKMYSYRGTSYKYKDNADKNSVLVPSLRPANLVRSANQARQADRPTEPRDLTFEVATAFIPSDFLRKDYSRWGQTPSLVSPG